MSDVLTRVKRLLAISDNSKDDILNDFIEMFSGIIKFHAGLIAEVPDELEWILTETVVARYNMIGNEHLKSEKVDIVSNTFRDDAIAPYLPFIKEWRSVNVIEDKPATGLVRVKFL